MGVFITGLERGERDATDSLDSRRRLEEAIKARISGRFLDSLEDFKLSSSRLMHRRLMHTIDDSPAFILCRIGNPHHGFNNEKKTACLSTVL